MTTTVLPILGVAFLLGFSIFIHELGHFLAAKFFKVPAPKFAIGFGPKIFSFKYGETEYLFNWIPFGGYVQMGAEEEVAPKEENKEANTEEADSKTTAIKEAAGDDPMGDMAALRSKPLYARVIILAAGCFMNYLTAVFIFSMMFFIGDIKLKPMESVVGYVPEKSSVYQAGLREGDRILKVNNSNVQYWDDVAERVKANSDKGLEIIIQREGQKEELKLLLPPYDKISEAQEDYILKDLGTYSSEIDPSYHQPAYKAGLRAGDKIIEISGVETKYFVQFHELINPKIGEEVLVKYLRDDEVHEVSIIPIKHPHVKEDVGMIGISPHFPDEKLEHIQFGFFQSFIQGFHKTNNFCILIPVETVRVFSKGFYSIKKNVGGPLMIANITYNQARKGAREYFRLFALINIMLMIMNLLPIPILDGGHIVISVIESVTRRPLPGKFLAPLFTIFFFLLISMALLVTFNDVLTIFF